MARLGPSVRDVTTTPEYHKKYKKFVVGMPKVELHAHIGGSVDPKLAWALIHQKRGEVVFNGIRFDTPYELEAFVHAPVALLRSQYPQLHAKDDLSVYLWKYNATRAVFEDVQNIPVLVEDIVRQYAEENTMHLELRTALKGLDLGSGADVRPPYSAVEEMEAYTSAIANAQEKYGMSIRLILCMRRGKSDVNLRLAEQTLEFAKAFRNRGVVGIDLAGAENGNEAKDFEAFFHAAKMAGLKTTIHGGEAAGDGAVEQIVERGLADRVGHGVAIRPGSKAFDYAFAYEIPFEVCVTSNRDCGAIRTDYDGRESKITGVGNHPIKDMVNDGIRVTVCCDNRQVSNTSLTGEFLKLNRDDESGQHLGLHRGRAVEFTLNAIRASFMPKDLQNRMRRKLVDYRRGFNVRP